MTMQVRPATPDDVEVLARFNVEMALETEHLTLNPDTVLAGVRRLVEDDTLGRYFVVESTAQHTEGEVLGALAVTSEWSDWRNGLFWWIQSVYVRPDARRQGVFAALYDHVQSLAKAESGVCGLRLYVERDNTRAQATYAGLGMHETDYRLYEVEFTAS